MQNQNPDELFFQKCDRVIDNSESLEETKRQIKEILEKWRYSHDEIMQYSKREQWKLYLCGK